MQQYETLNKLMDIWIILALEIQQVRGDNKLLNAVPGFSGSVPGSSGSVPGSSGSVPGSSIEDVIYNWRREAEHKMIQSQTGDSECTATGTGSAPSSGMTDEKVRHQTYILYILYIL